MRTLAEAIESDRENEKKKVAGQGRWKRKVMKSLWVNEDEETLKHHLYLLLCSMVEFQQIYSIL